MAATTTVARKPKTPTIPPTKDEADILARQVNAMLNADGHLHNIIADDVTLGVADSPFTHPLYTLRIKLDTVRGRKAKRLAAYARSLRKNGAVRKV